MSAAAAGTSTPGSGPSTAPAALWPAKRTSRTYKEGDEWPASDIAMKRISEMDWGSQPLRMRWKRMASGPHSSETRKGRVRARLSSGSPSVMPTSSMAMCWCGRELRTKNCRLLRVLSAKGSRRCRRASQDSPGSALIMISTRSSLAVDHWFCSQRPTKEIRLKSLSERGGNKRALTGTARSKRRRNLSRTAAVILSFFMRNVFSLVFDKLYKGFLHNIRERAVVLVGQCLQVLPEPFLPLFRQVDVQMRHIFDLSITYTKQTETIQSETVRMY